jgi:hypothetical protein
MLKVYAGLISFDTIPEMLFLIVIEFVLACL